MLERGGLTKLLGIFKVRAKITRLRTFESSEPCYFRSGVQ